MANFGMNLESPETGVELPWEENLPDEWHDSLKKIYRSYETNEFSKFFYPSDVHLMYLLCERHNLALHNPDTTAATWKTISDDWGHFGATMKSRANIRYTIARTTAQEDYSEGVKDLLTSVFESDD